MAPRGRIGAPSDDMDRSSLMSSPDPLNASVNRGRQNTNAKTTRATKTPLASSSPSKQNRRPSLSEQMMEHLSSSPSKSMVMNTGRPGGASPWRIKVTVEAEPGSGSDENGSSPIVQHITRTTTSTVPLKDPDASSPVKRRGRPRKSDVAGGAQQKRSGTPVRRTRQSSPTKARRSSVSASDANLADVSDAPPKKKRGRPRKSVAPVPVEEVTTAHEEEAELENGAANEEAEDQLLPVADPSHSQVVEPTDREPSAHFEEEIEQHSTRRTERMVLPATGDDPFVSGPSVQKVKRRRRSSLQQERPVIQTPEIDLTKKLRERRGTPHAKLVAPTVTISDESSELDTPSETDEDARVHVDEPDAVFEDQEENGNAPDETMYALDEGATMRPDDTTMLESENFSMISVDSLPSGGGLSSPPDSQSNNRPAPPTMGSLLSGTHLKVPSMSTQAKRNSPRQSRTSPYQPGTVPSEIRHIKSSPPAPITRKQTPVMDHRSPSNPPALQPAEYEVTEVETPKIGRVVKAGVALQGVLDPERLTPTGKSKEEALHEQSARLDDLFRGFSEGTRRQLQAGLRLGEQLANERRGQQSSPALSSPIKSTAASYQAEEISHTRNKHQASRLLTPEDEYSLPIASGSIKRTEVHYPSLIADQQDTQLISPARSEDEMSWRVDTPPVNVEMGKFQQPIVEYPTVATASRSGDRVQHATLLDDDEPVAPAIPIQPTRRERAFARKTQRAAKQTRNDDYADMWQEEASRSSVEDVEPEADSPEPQSQGMFAHLAVPKPPRGKLSRTWRRSGGNDFNYSDEAEPEPETASNPTPSSSEHSDDMSPPTLDKGKGRLLTPPAEEYDEEVEAGKTIVITNKGKGRLEMAVLPKDPYDDEEDDESSDASDDTGMFFHSNLPNVFSRKQLSRDQEVKKVDLSMLLDDGESLVPESSPAFVRNTQSRAGYSRTPEVPHRRQENVVHSTLLDDGQSIVPTSSSPASRRHVPSSPVAQQSRVTPQQSSAVKSRRSEVPSSDRPRQSSARSAARSEIVIEHSTLLDDGDAVTPEAPLSQETRTPVSGHRNPFKNTPPQFATFQASPVKSSPLRNELRASSSPDSYHGPRADESTLPIGSYSSPFQTVVDDSAISTASDEAQILREMERQGATEGRTDSSIRRLRDEADELADVYNTQHRSFNTITEVTEPSRTMQSIPSSPPTRHGDGKRPRESPLKPLRNYEPLFGTDPRTLSPAQRRTLGLKPRPSPRMPPRPSATGEEPRIAVAPREPDPKPSPVPAASSGGLFSKLTTSLWGAVTPPAAPPSHPVTAKFDPLPKVEPWTQTHYKALDKLYQLYKKQPTLFAPSSSSSESNTNDALLSDFLANNRKNFVGANYSVWGYEMEMDEALIVLAAVFSQLLTLRDVAEYERATGKQISMGDCNPGTPGMMIDGEEVVRRLATVVMGEALRRDEKRGMVIDRSGEMEISFPE